MEDYDTFCEVQIEGVPTFNSPKCTGIYEELPYEIPNNVRSLAARIYNDNVNKTTRGNNRLYIKFTCVCIAMSELHYDIYDPYKIANIFGIKSDNIGKALKSNIKLYRENKKITKILPISILRSRLNEFGMRDTSDFLIFADEFILKNGKREFILNSSPVGVAAGIFAYYCEISGLLSFIPLRTISSVFGISEQIINQKKEEIKRVDN